MQCASELHVLSNVNKEGLSVVGLQVTKACWGVRTPHDASHLRTVHQVVVFVHRDGRHLPCLCQWPRTPEDERNGLSLTIRITPVRRPYDTFLWKRVACGNKSKLQQKQELNSTFTSSASDRCTTLHTKSEKFARTEVDALGSQSGSFATNTLVTVMPCLDTKVVALSATAVLHDISCHSPSPIHTRRHLHGVRHIGWSSSVPLMSTSEIRPALQRVDSPPATRQRITQHGDEHRTASTRVLECCNTCDCSDSQSARAQHKRRRFPYACNPS